MGYTAVARVSDLTWTACAVHDDIQFGLTPGGQLDLKTTLCFESRESREPIVIDNSAKTRTIGTITLRGFITFRVTSRCPLFCPMDGTLGTYAPLILNRDKCRTSVRSACLKRMRS
jgi:hypothetical protein